MNKMPPARDPVLELSLSWIDLKAARDECQPGILAWWGTLQDLMDGRGIFPRKIRKYYRDKIDEPENSEPILDRERRNFVQGIKEYGI